MPQQPPLYAIGELVIPKGVDREEYPQGYKIGLIALDREDQTEWVYWGYNDWTSEIGPGFAEPHIERYTVVENKE